MLAHRALDGGSVCQYQGTTRFAPKPVLLRSSIRAKAQLSSQQASGPPPECSSVSHGSRRSFLGGALATALSTTVKGAEAADIVSWVLPASPEPIRFPRKPLDVTFAVLLMRSSYEAVDSLDFIPMDLFQKLFWKLRASEQEAYNLQYSPLKPRLGDLTDPLYFDFISFSQYATIAKELPNGQQVFKEYCPPEDCPDAQSPFVVVRRNPDLADNAKLPAEFLKRTGDNIYTGLKDGFRGKQFGAPPPTPTGAPFADVMAGVRMLLDIMVHEGYALKAEVVESEQPTSPGAHQFTVKLQGSANLWGVAALNARRSIVVNAYDAVAIDAYLRACGRSASYNISVAPTMLETTWVVAGA